MINLEKQVAASASDLLDEKKTSVVIRNFASADKCRRLSSNTTPDLPGVFGDLDIAIVYRMFDVFHALDDLVEEWAVTRNTYGYAALSGLSHAVRRSGGIRPHVDGPTVEADGSHRLFGPITASLRIDSNPNVKREITVNKWPTTDACLKDGFPTEKYIRQEPDRRRILAEKFNWWLGSRTFTQNPGDLVLFRGHPRPVRHAISQQGKTEQIIFGYQLQGEGNASQHQTRLRNAEYDEYPTTRWGACEWSM